MNGGGASGAQQAGQSDIFNAGGAAGGQQGQQQGDTASPQTKTSEMAGAGGSNSAQNGPDTKETKQNTSPAADASAYLRNQPTDAQGFLSGYQKQASDIDTNLQKEADDWMTNTVKTTEDKYNPNVDTGTLDKAISGDGKAASDVSSYFSAAPQTVDSFKNKTDTHIKGLEDLGSTDGLSTSLFKGGNENYGQGMASFDAMLLGQNKDFQQGRADLVNRQAQLDGKVPDLLTSTTQKAQDKIKADRDAGTTAAKTYLQGKEGEIKSGAQSKLDAYNAALENLRKGPNKDFVAAQAQQAMSQIAPQVGDYAGKIGPIDASQFYHVGGNVNDASQFYSDDDAKRFNTIEGLLGNGGKLASAGGALGPKETFDAQGYQQAISAAVAAQKQKEATAAAQVEAQKQEFAKQQAAIEAAKQAAIQPPGAPSKVPTGGQPINNGSMIEHGINYVTGGKGAKLDTSQVPQLPTKPVTVADAKSEGTKAKDKVVSGVHKLSDERTKKNIESPGSDEVHNFLKSLEPKTFEYKKPDDPLAGHGKQLGVMAQDLEKSHVGKSAVEDHHGKKAVDYGKLFPAITAAMGDMHKRMKKLEGKA